MKARSKSMFHILTLFATLASLLGSALTFTPAYAATFTVSNTNDSGAGSLRQAILDAEANGAGSDTINVSAGTITLSSQLPQVTTTIIINGLGSSAASTIVQANVNPNTANYRVFEVGGSGNLTLNKLTVRNGKCDGSCNTEQWGGGGIYNNGILTVTNSAISNNFSVDNNFGFGGGIFNENNSTTLTITNTTFTGNSATKKGGGIYNSESSNTVFVTDGFFDSNTVTNGSGGGIYNKTGTMTLTSTSPSKGYFTGNTAPSGGDGGGIGNGSGTLNITNIDFVLNTASTGAGLSNIDGTANITGSLFSTNTATNSGGGISVSGTTNITTSSFHDNIASNGGGISANFGGTLTVTNSTFYKNSASGNGGGIENRDNLVVNNSTFSENSAANGGGIYSDPFDRDNSNPGDFSLVTLKNTILANSTSGRDCYFTNNVAGATITGNNNIIEANGLAGNTCGTTSPITSDPNLGALTGFPLPQYYPLNPGSPALDAGDNATCSSTSQNGINRPQGPKCDIGSFELDTTLPIVTAFTATTPSNVNIPITSFTATDNASVTGYLITTSSTPPAAGATGWSATVPTSFAVAGSATYTLYPWAKDATGNVSAVFGTPRTVVVLSTLATFADVPTTYWANSFIERLYNAGITGGCATTPSLIYCPDNSVTRAQMAIFLLRGIHGSGYTPPAIGSGSGFTDVPSGSFADTWIKQLATEGITGGCGTGIYCPDATVTRAQMAIFILRSTHGSSFTPSPAIGVFSDVPNTYWAAAWIEQLASEGITGGCGTGIYCPDSPVTRAQMAVFLVKAFGLP